VEMCRMRSTRWMSVEASGSFPRRFYRSPDGSEPGSAGTKRGSDPCFPRFNLAYYVYCLDI